MRDYLFYSLGLLLNILSEIAVVHGEFTEAKAAEMLSVTLDEE
jgi:hypothetical protein